VGADAVALPGDLRRAVRTEFGRAFHAPYELPIVVTVNGLLMTGSWFLLPPHWKDALFSLHGTLAFAMVLAAWMMSDVPATNVLGPDARRVVAALDDPVMFRRLLYAKNIVLWTVVAPVCTVIALAIGINSRDYVAMGFSIMAIVVMPFGALGISAWVGIRFPYHPIPIAERWAARRSWRHMLVRWLVLAVTPYGLVPMVAAVLLAPSLALWAAFAAHGLNARLSDFEFAWGVMIACAVSAVAFVGGHRAGERLARHRKAKLSAYLSDPTLG